MKVTIDLGITIDFETTKEFSEGDTFLEHIFKAMRGEGDLRKGINMKADIGWYVQDKLKENLAAKGLYEDMKITGHSVHIKRKKEEGVYELYKNK